MVLLPTVSWAQRKDKLYLTIDLQDVKDEKISLNNVDDAGVLTFSGKAGKDHNSYQVEIKLFEPINVEESKVSVSPRNVFVVIIKQQDGHWPRLTKESGKHMNHIKCDWNKWVDEDEEDEKPEFDLGGYDFSNFGGGGMGGMGGGGFEGMPNLEDAGGVDEQDSDDDEDDELPDLVK